VTGIDILDKNAKKWPNQGAGDGLGKAVPFLKGSI